MNNFFISSQGTLYTGEYIPGSREATEEEVVNWINMVNQRVTESEARARLGELDAKSIRTIIECLLYLAESGVKLPEDARMRLLDIEEKKESLRKQLG